MLGFLKNLFGGKKQETTEQAPYKIEAPVAVVPPTSTALPVSDFPFPPGTPGSGFATESEPKAKKKPATRKPAGEKKPAVKAKTVKAKKKAS